MMLLISCRGCTRPIDSMPPQFLSARRRSNRGEVSQIPALPIEVPANLLLPYEAILPKGNGDQALPPQIRKVVIGVLTPNAPSLG